MTLSPTDNRNVVGVDGPEYPLADFCAVKGCAANSLERHHIWRKSAIAGDYWWIQLSSGMTHPNCVNLCNFHHTQITDNKAMLVIKDGLFAYSDLQIGTTQELDWQPPSEINMALDLESPKKNTRGSSDHDAPGHDKDTCPTCLRPLPRKKDTSEEKKVRKVYSIAVPMDLWEENGAEVLGTLIEETRKELARHGLPYGDEESVKYHIVCTALSLFILHAGEITNNG